MVVEINKFSFDIVSLKVPVVCSNGGSQEALKFKSLELKEEV